jgi:hypothetical protein
MLICIAVARMRRRTKRRPGSVSTHANVLGNEKPGRRLRAGLVSLI